jgi:hypothetical protein
LAKRKWTLGEILLAVGPITGSVGLIILNIEIEGSFTRPYEIEGAAIMAIGGLLTLLSIVLISKQKPYWEVENQNSQSNTMICATCQQEIPISSNYCPFCGDNKS